MCFFFFFQIICCCVLVVSALAAHYVCSVSVCLLASISIKFNYVYRCIPFPVHPDFSSTRYLLIYIYDLFNYSCVAIIISITYLTFLFLNEVYDFFFHKTPNKLPLCISLFLYLSPSLCIYLSVLSFSHFISSSLGS